MRKHLSIIRAKITQDSNDKLCARAFYLAVLALLGVIVTNALAIAGVYPNAARDVVAVIAAIRGAK